MFSVTDLTLHFSLLYLFVSSLVKPSAKSSPENVLKMVGQKLKLDCEARGDPTPAIKWKKDGLPQIPRAKLDWSSGGITLVIENVILEDNGVYVCEVHNRAGKASSRSRVKIIEAGH